MSTDLYELLPKFLTFLKSLTIPPIGYKVSKYKIP